MLLATTIAPACTPSQAEPRRERPLEILVASTAATLDPRYSTDAVAIRTTRLVHAGLVRLDPDTLKPIPYAAERLDFLDSRTLEVTLRELRFHSGKPFDSDDVCATLAAFKDPEVMSPHRAVVEKIESCEAVSPRVVRIRLGGPHATLLTDLEVPILRAAEATAPPRPAGDLDGLGPYRIAHFGHGVIELEPSDGSPLGRPCHGVVVRTVRDENARALRLLAQRADIAPNAISPTLLPALEGRSGLSLRSRPGANVTYLLARSDRGPTGNVELRRAIAAGLDRELMARALFDGRATVARTLFPPGSMAHPHDLPELAHAPDEARKIIAEHSPRPLSLLTSTDRFRLTLARAIAQQLGDLGLSVEVVPLDAGVLFQRLASGDFDLATLQMPELTEPHLLRWFFHSASIPLPDRPARGANRGRYSNPEVDAWLDEAGSLTDRTERAELYGKIAHRFAIDLPVVPLFHESQLAVVSERAKGFEPSAEGRWLSVATLGDCR